jgi:hypothetical protein
MVLGLVSLAACTADEPAETAAAEDPAAAAELDALRTAAAKYADVNVALGEGYVPDGMCTTAAEVGLPPETGAMGIHYFRPDLLQITATAPRVDGTGTHIDFTQPAVLLYEPQQDGSLELVAIENAVFAAAWSAAGNVEPPAFMGTPFDYMADDPNTPEDEGHMFVPHYDRHVWLFRENPNGVFAQWNPTVSCEHFTAPAPPPSM